MVPYGKNAKIAGNPAEEIVMKNMPKLLLLIAASAVSTNAFGVDEPQEKPATDSHHEAPLATATATPQDGVDRSPEGRAALAKSWELAAAERDRDYALMMKELNAKKEADAKARADVDAQEQRVAAQVKEAEVAKQALEEAAAKTQANIEEQGGKVEVTEQALDAAETKEIAATIAVVSAEVATQKTDKEGSALKSAIKTAIQSISEGISRLQQEKNDIYAKFETRRKEISAKISDERKKLDDAFKQERKKIDTKIRDAKKSLDDIKKSLELEIKKDHVKSDVEPGSYH